MRPRAGRYDLLASRRRRFMTHDPRTSSSAPRSASGTPAGSAPSEAGGSLRAERLIDRLGSFPAVIRAAVEPLYDDELRWKPAPEHWSILEVCRHLVDEEHEDFRVRIESTLSDPARPWPPLELEGVATARRYNEADRKTTLDEFAAGRARNVDWLRAKLSARDDWSTAHQHPRFGPLAAGMLLASWAAHDALHLRQIAKRLHGLAARDGGPYPVIYAGEWTA